MREYFNLCARPHYVIATSRSPAPSAVPWIPPLSRAPDPHHDPLRGRALPPASILLLTGAGAAGAMDAAPVSSQGTP